MNRVPHIHFSAPDHLTGFLPSDLQKVLPILPREAPREAQFLNYELFVNKLLFFYLSHLWDSTGGSIDSSKKSGRVNMSKHYTAMTASALQDELDRLEAMLEDLDVDDLYTRAGIRKRIFDICDALCRKENAA